MNMAEFNRVFAPDNEINAGDNGLSSFYKNSKVVKLFFHFVVLAVSVWFIDFTRNNDWSAEYVRQLAADPKLEGGTILMVWPCAVMLLHLYMYRRRCFYWSLPTGILWLSYGDLIAAPYWMAVLGYFLAVFMRFKSFTTLLISLLMLGGMVYFVTYIDVWHANFFYLLAAILFLAIWIEKKSARTALKQSSKAIPSRLNMFSRDPDEAEEVETDDTTPRFPPRPQADESVWAPGEKEAQEYEEQAPEPPAPEEKPVLTTAQRPFAVYWLELHKLKQHPALPALLQSELDGVMGYAERILDCMQDDPNDVQPGSAFLDRYLTQVTTVVKRGLLLSGQLSTHGKTQEVEQQCLNALQALNSAFAQQHLRLLENDTLAFETDLTVLNSLLKTDGFKQ
ncbi:5-bromo-4-chloroindolyl phosphate hydrolysis family protein [Pantoea agglomerans]|uniref:5-bromo-4-chloroindolyl phosphate hydrolysis family protein n=1 Tax=Enterobacter agglomerans TaxID=549 RepID=A0ACC5RNC1_ENTAG|nr:5-bromo-4-chloroindolyl phosphate hydrolysis family protein [Pantoea agglomerans]MBK4726207.1 5-bromo-4-chloroindolyl phosphate hydrolysis family protein [Pantoea agglomerans]